MALVLKLKMFHLNTMYRMWLLDYKCDDTFNYLLDYVAVINQRG